MAVVTVDQGTIERASTFSPAAYAVQRFFRNDSISSSEQNVAAGLMAAAGVELLVYHWSGGYSNATGYSGAGNTQTWSTCDFAPTAGNTARQWTDYHTSRKGLDTYFDDKLARMIAQNSSTQMALVMFDHPVAMLGGSTRANQDPFTWPASTKWNGDPGMAGDLASEILARYPGKIKAFSYGQELKGIASRTNTTELDAYAAGYTAFATYMRANHPTIELWYPHLNYFATDSLATRATAMDALIAGGSSLSANDETIINRLMDQVDPDLVDRMTWDVSVVDYSTSDTWRGSSPYTNAYTNIVQRISVTYHLQRVLKAKMLSRWGVEKPMVGIEVYFDVNQDIGGDYATEAQSAALQTAMAIWSMRGGVTYHMRWEPQSGTPGSESPDGNLESWFKGADGTAWDALEYMTALTDAIPVGTDLFDVATDNSSIVAVAGGDKVFLLNTSGGAISTSVTATNGSLGAQSIAAYSYLVQTLPTSTTASAIAATGTGAAMEPDPVGLQRGLILRF